MGSAGRFEKTRTTYYLPPGYRVEQNTGELLLRRSDGSAVVTLYGQRAIGEIIERYAWADQPRQEVCRTECVCERFFRLPVAIVLGVLYLAGAVPMGLCAAALYCLWSP
jgi:hypothetical protein